MKSRQERINYMTEFLKLPLEEAQKLADEEDRKQFNQWWTKGRKMYFEHINHQKTNKLNQDLKAKEWD